MADSESTQGKSTKRSAATADAKPDSEAWAEGQADDTATTPPIPVSQLVADAGALLGYPPHVAAGGLSRYSDGSEELDINAAKAEIEDWLQRPVQTDPAHDEEE